MDIEDIYNFEPFWFASLSKELSVDLWRFRIKRLISFNDLTKLIDTVYSMYPKFIKKSAIKENVVDKYFVYFLQENEITEEDIVSAVNLAKKALRR